MQIIGKKHLDDNYYQSITIHEDKIIIYSRGIIIYSNGVLNTIDSSYNFSDELKGKSDEEIIDLIIDYYLRSTKINKISKSEVSGVSGRKLKFKTNISNESRRKIFRKYEDDRLDHLYETEANNFYVDGFDALTSYSKNRYVLATNEKGIARFEFDFLQEMIEMFFKDEIIHLTYDSLNNNGLKIISSNDNSKKIRISPTLACKCCIGICELVSDHNKIITDNALMQLKLEVRR